MKKIIVFFLFFNLFVSSIKADENYNISLIYDKLPSYTIKIPTQIDITNNDVSLEYFVKGDIYANQILNVVFEKETYITDGKQNVKVNCAQNKTTYLDSELSDSYLKQEVMISHAYIPAGSFTGELNVEIYLTYQ